VEAGRAENARREWRLMDVLLVEDEALVREMLAEDMADAGLDVAEAPSAEAALEAAPPPPEGRCGRRASWSRMWTWEPGWTGSRWRPRRAAAGPIWASW
jgi:hypothetical protein